MAYISIEYLRNKFTGHPGNEEMPAMIEKLLSAK